MFNLNPELYDQCKGYGKWSTSTGAQREEGGGGGGGGVPLVLGVAPCAAGSTARSNIMGKKTPISALRAWRNLMSRVKNMEQVRAWAWLTELVTFFSRLRHRYCLMAAMKRSE
jgi:hypothetical protein